jgi:hypothetical protein
VAFIKSAAVVSSSIPAAGVWSTGANEVRAIGRQLEQRLVSGVLQITAPDVGDERHLRLDHRARA